MATTRYLAATGEVRRDFLRSGDQVTAATMPGHSGKSLIGKLVSGLGRTQAARRRIAALITQAREHVTAVAALASADLGGFTVLHHGGWFVVAGSLLLLDIEMRG